MTGTDGAGLAVRVVRAWPGQIVRIENAGKLRVAERYEGSDGVIEAYRTVHPEDDGSLLLRASLGTRAWLLSDLRKSVWVAHERPLGREGFDLEDGALAWAEGRSHAPPRGEGGDRLALFARFDEVVGPEIARAPRPEVAELSAKAARRVIARRVSSLLRAPYRYPFFHPDVVAEGSGPRVAVKVEGPALMQCEVRASSGISARITERGRLRSSVERRTHASAGAIDLPAIPVPAGAHEYSVEVAASGDSKGGTSIACFQARPVQRLGHGGDESADLDAAMRACDANDAGALCAIALGLAGRDEELERRSSGGSTPLLELARALTTADAYDGARALEARASAGDRSALSHLAEAARGGVDGSLASGWAHAASESSTWTVTGEGDASSWTLIEHDPACSDTKADLPLVTTTERSVDAARWRSAHAIHLSVDAPCESAEPIALQVDGSELRAQPSEHTARWTIVVGKPRVTIRRVDAGPGTVRLASKSEGDGCAAHGARARAPLRASSSPSLSFSGTAPGLEVWVPAGVRSASVRVAAGDEELEVIARPGEGGTAALDEQGRRWLRAGRFPLPDWAAKGVTVRGGADVAVRALTRTMRTRDRAEQTSGDAEPAERIDSERLLDLSRAILSAPPERRGAIHQERAILLARAGEAKAAREDAEAARQLGVPGDPEALVRRWLRARESPLVSRPFGLEADFDDGARRCRVDATLPRARLAAIDAELRSGSPRFDPAVAARAVELGDPADPRLASIEARTLATSRWREIREGIGAPRVARPHEARAEGPIALDGLLRVRSLVGALPDSALVTAQHPASFALGTMPGRARVEIVCAPRASSKAASESCPLEIVVDGQARPATVGPDGSGTLSLDPKARAAQLRMKATAADWGAAVRIVFDRKVPGTRHDPRAGWILEVPEVDRRFLVGAGKPLEIPVDAPGLLRVAAWPEPGEPPVLVAMIGEEERPIATDGRWIVVPVVRPGVVRLVAKSGAVTADVAERVNDGTVPAVSPTTPRSPEPPASPVPSIAFDGAPSGWRDAARSEPLPPSGPASWATLQITGSVVTSNWREGASTNAPDTFGQQSLLVRRRFGTVGPWASIGAAVRERAGEPSVGGRLALFQQLADARIGAGADVHTQQIEGRDATTVHPRGLLEYAWRARPSLTLFPRIGFDGHYTDLPARPTDARQIDDDVYSPTRFVRRSIGYLQGVARWAPYFDVVMFTRIRASLDLGSGELASASARAGGLVSLGPFDVSAQLDATSYPSTPGARARAGVDVGPGGHVTSLFWLSRDSVALEPGVGGSARVGDGRWQAFASLALVLGHGRGRRDFSANDLGFYDGFAGSAPWRGSASGTGR